MLYRQDITIDEYNFGRRTVRFAVSDTYKGLTGTDAVETNIFQLESVKQDLNISKDEFAVDSFSFSATSLACATDADRAALAFCLEAQDKNRFCIVQMFAEGATPTDADTIFTGKIEEKITGEDKYWESGEYETLINPGREYKFSALTFDMSILEKILLNSTIKWKKDGITMTTDGLFSGLTNDHFTAAKISNAFACYSNSPSGYHYWYYRLYKLSGILDRLFKIASDKLCEMYCDSNYYDTDGNMHNGIWVSLKPSNIGIRALPTYYNIGQNQNCKIGNSKPWAVTDQSFYVVDSNEKTFGFKMSDAKYTEPLIDGRMILPNMDRPFYSDVTEDATDEKAQVQQTRYQSEREYGFYNLENLSNMIFTIARNLGCYIKSQTGIDANGNIAINIEFTPRGGLYETSPTYIIGATDASIDLSSENSDADVRYYCVPNDLADKGSDIIVMYPKNNQKSWASEFEKSSARTAADTERSDDKNKKSITYKRALFSTAQILECIRWIKSDKTRYIEEIRPAGSRIYTNDDSKSFSVMTNALYMQSTAQFDTFENFTTQPDTSVTAYRPVGKIYFPTSSETYALLDLDEYVNTLLANDSKYYKSEYSLTVPFWDGFSKESDGANADYKNLKLGSVVTLKETVNNAVKETNFVVVSKETALDKPEVKLKLQNLSRFAYFNYTPASTEKVIVGKITNTDYEPEDDGDNTGESSPAEIVNIDVGDVIYNDLGVLRKAEANTKCRGEIVGVASYVNTDTATITFIGKGEISNTAYNFTVGKAVFLTTSAKGTLNITQSVPGFSTSTCTIDGETKTINLWVRLGYAVSNTSFMYNLTEFEII